MSLAETQQIMSMLQEIMQMLDGAQGKINTISDSIGFSPKGGSHGPSMRRELHVVNLYAASLQRWSGSSTIAGMMNKVQMAESQVMELYLLANAVNALAAGPTPFGLLYAGALLLSLANTAQNISTNSQM